MAKPTEQEAREMAVLLKPFLDDLGNKGGKLTMTPGKPEHCPTCGAPQDHRHIQTDLEIEKDRHQHDVEKLSAERDAAKQASESTNVELANAFKRLQYHIEHYPNGCQDGENCSTNQALHRIAQDAKKHLTPDDLNVNLVGDYLRKIQAIGIGKTKSDGEYQVIKSIQIGSK